MEQTIYFASDHAGFALKNELVTYVRDVLGYEVVDCGAHEYDENDDFTDYIAKAAREVSANPKGARAIILGGSGQGEAMLANRFHDVRAVVYYGGNEEIIKLSRIHNDANVLSLGARFMQSEEAKKMTSLWLQTDHKKVEKYDRRIEDIETESSSGEKPLVPDTLVRTLVPSLPAHSFTELQDLLVAIEGSIPGIQIDIADGIFVDNISWPFTETDPTSALKELRAYGDFDIEIDCMCMNPESHLDLFVSLGIGRVIVHAESTTLYDECVAHAKKHGYKIGLAVKNSTSPEILAKYAGAIDFVQVMGIEHIGMQGQMFDERTYETVASIRAQYPYLEIAVDGGVSKDTIPGLLKAGANRFAPGSAIVKAQDPVEAYTQLAALVGL